MPRIYISVIFLLSYFPLLFASHQSINHQILLNAVHVVKALLYLMHARAVLMLYIGFQVRS